MTIRNTLILFTGLLLTACGPTIALMDVDVKQPAVLPVNFDNKEIVIFNTLDDSMLSPETEAQFQLDSLLVNQFSEGFRDKLEASLGLPQESIAIYNLFCSDGPRGSLADTTYLRHLAIETGATSLVMVDSLRFGDVQNSASQGRAGINTLEYVYSYAAMPCRIVLRVFDVSKDRFVAYLPMRDTVYWEFLHKADAKNVSQLLSLQKDRYCTIAARGMGEDFASDMQARWQTQERVLFTYRSNRKWLDAMEAAYSFEWEKARKTWMAIATEKAGKKIAAYAAYNIAVCCEMLGQFDLAKEWLDAAQKRWSIPEIRYYRAMLEESKQSQRYVLLQQSL